MSAALEVQKAVVAAIKADATFGALAGDRIYARVPDEVTIPYARIAAVDTTPAIETQDGEGNEVVVTLHVWAALDKTAWDMIAAQRAAIHNQDLSLDSETNIIGREISATVRQSDPPLAQGVQRFRFLTHP